VSKLALEQAYPGIAFRPHTRSWWARLKGVLPECEHLEEEIRWTATYLPDTVYLRGMAKAVREPERPAASLCLKCTLTLLKADASVYTGRVVAFEPDPNQMSQYFFVSKEDFEAAGILPELQRAIDKRLHDIPTDCSAEKCHLRAKWLWIPRKEVSNLDEVALIHAAKGRAFCGGHGVAQLCLALGTMEEANLEYLNAPYAEAGAYVWI
jgi:hypothetical protein